MWGSRALLPLPGRHNNCERQPLMDKDRSISFAIVITSLGLVSRVWPQAAASSYAKRLITHHGPMPSVNGFWVACVASVWITCSSCRRSSCIVSCVPLSSTSTKPGRRKRIRQQIPERSGEPVPLDQQRGKIHALPVLSGLHHDYREIHLTAEGCTKKRRAPGVGVCLTWEVADPQSRFPCFSDDDKQGTCVVP